MIEQSQARSVDSRVDEAKTNNDLNAENQRLREELAVLEEIASSVAEANHNAFEMMLEVERAQAEVETTNSKLRSIIDNVQFGFFIVDTDLRVSDEVTHSCLTLFGQERVASRMLDEVLGLDPSDSAMLRLAVEEVFSDVLPEELSCEQVPTRFEIGKRVISMRARALRNETGVVHSLLFSVIDVTDLEEEKRQNNENQALLRILRDRSSFLNFVAELRSGVKTATSALVAGEQITVRRLVHTIKGTSAIFGLLDVVSVAHLVEEADEITSGGLAAIEDTIRHFLRKHYSVLEVEWDEECQAPFQVSAGSLGQLETLLAAGDLAGARSWIACTRMIPAQEIWGPLDSLVEQLSTRYGKRIRLQVEGGDLRLNARLFGSVLGTIHHVVRNAVVHGIEELGERGGKDSCGLVRVGLRQQEGGQYVLEIEDDGKGIDTGALSRRLVERGVCSAEDFSAMSDNDKYAFIFDDGISTQKEANEAAGRGVGLSAVKEAVTAAGGQIEVRSVLGQGTLVRITLSASVPSSI